MIGGAIVVFWLAMTGVLLHRELGEHAVLGRRPLSPRLPHAGESWLGIELAGKPIGTVHLITQPGEREGRAGVTSRIDLRLRARMFDAPVEMRLTGSLWRALAAPRAAFDVRVEAGAHSVRATGTVADGLLRGEVLSAGASVPVQARVGDLLGAGDDVLGLLPGPALAPGQEATFRAFDPFTLRPTAAHARCVRTETITVDGRAVPTRVVEVALGKAAVTAWLDDEGGVVRAQTPFGLTLRRLGRAEALATRETGEPPELLTAVEVVPTGLRPRRDARRMVVRVSGASAAELPADETQRLEADGASVLVSPSPGPLAVPPGLADGPQELARYLSCDALVACNDPKIRALAAAIVASERDPWARALLIGRWVNANLAKRPVLGLPSATDVLATREGDCSEHTVLFTALARAAGVPTRMTAGLVWSDELQAFGYHAWPEVFVGRWVWTDPTLGQPVADATHLKLATGGIEDWQRIAAFLGRIRLEVTEVE